jgi:hypothetical protein
MSHPKHNILNAAYLFYYATEVGLQEGTEETGLLARRLRELVGDAIVIANQASFDVFNALTLMDNMKFINDLKVGFRLVRRTAYTDGHVVWCWEWSIELLPVQLAHGGTVRCSVG